MKNAKPQPKQAKYDITFVVPVYNAAQYLDECLQSLIAQSTNQEIICINDGSTDNSLAVLQKWANKHPEIRIINQENKGLSITRNVGINEAKGRYIWFVDADDLLQADAAELVSLADRENVDIVRGLMLQENQAGSGRGNVSSGASPTVSQKAQAGERYAELMSGLEYLHGMIQVGYMPKVWAGFYRTAFLREYGCYFPDARMNAEDEVFELKVFTAKPDTIVLEVAFPVYFYRCNASGISRNYAKQFEGSLMAVAMLWAWYETLQTQFVATPPDDKRWYWLANALRLTRFITLRLNYYACGGLFLTLNSEQQAKLKHLITPTHLLHLDEFCPLMLTTDAGPYYNRLSTETFGRLGRVKALFAAK